MSQNKIPKLIFTDDNKIIAEEDKSWKELRDANLAERFGEQALTENEIKLHFNLKPKNKAQELYINAITTSVITFGYGPAGTAKSFVACYIGAKLLSEKKIEKLVITRPIVGCGPSKGYLPGSSLDKLKPYVRQLMDYLEEFLSEKQLKELMRQELVRFEPTDELRGSSFKNAMIIVDEAQNLSEGELVMLLTRLGENSCMVINGDLSQSDVFRNSMTDFEKIMKKLRPLQDEISYIEFKTSDIVRSGIVRRIIEVLNGEI